MFSQEKNNANTKDGVETIVGPSLKVKGNFKGKGNIIVEGEVDGNLKTEGYVYIGDKAQITANIEAKTARIGGIVTGNVKIKEHLDIVKSAHINGDIECKSLSVEKGAQLNGKCSMANPNQGSNSSEQSPKKEKNKQEK